MPKQLYVALAIVLALFGLYRYGHHAGWVERDQEMQPKSPQRMRKPVSVRSSSLSKLTQQPTN